MNTLAGLKCFHHADRASIARCPRCTRHFCRECITEHGPTLLCAACLREETADTSDTAARPWSHLIAAARPILHLFAAVFILWVAFFSIGRLLLNIPSEVHGATDVYQDIDQGFGQ